MKMKMKFSLPNITNWKTSAGGMASILTAVAALLSAWHNGTMPDWNTVGSLLILGYVGIVSKDHDK